MSFSDEYESALRTYSKHIEGMSPMPDLFLTFGSSILRMLADIKGLDPTTYPLIDEKLLSFQYPTNEKPYLAIEDFWRNLDPLCKRRIRDAQAPCILEDVMLLGRKMYELTRFIEALHRPVKSVVLASHFHQETRELVIIRPRSPSFASQVLDLLS